MRNVVKTRNGDRLYFLICRLRMEPVSILGRVEARALEWTPNVKSRGEKEGKTYHSNDDNDCTHEHFGVLANVIVKPLTNIPATNSNGDENMKFVEDRAYAEQLLLLPGIEDSLHTDIAVANKQP